MKLASKWTLAAVIVCSLFIFSHVAVGQEPGNVLINTNPQGSLVRLAGDLDLSGVSPVKFDRSLTGQYRIEIVRAGYEDYRDIAYFSESQFSQLDIRLVPKTKTKAFFRSLIIPGWGQRYYGNNTKSTLFGLGTIASAIGYVFVRDDFDSKEKAYNDKLAEFNSATLWSDLPRLEAELRDAQEKADDAENMVNVMTAVTVGIYAINLLDSFLFFPEYDKYTEYKAITAAPDIDADRVGVSFSVKF